jgi:hypothetical protein
MFNRIILRIISCLFSISIGIGMVTAKRLTLQYQLHIFENQTH